MNRIMNWWDSFNNEERVFIGRSIIFGIILLFGSIMIFAVREDNRKLVACLELGNKWDRGACIKTNCKEDLK